MSKSNVKITDKSHSKHKRCSRKDCRYFMRRLYVRLSSRNADKTYTRWWQPVGWVCLKHHIDLDKDATFNFAGRVSKRALYIELSGDSYFVEKETESNISYTEEQYKREWINVGTVYENLDAEINPDVSIGEVDFGQWSPRR
ncbi:MAG: hypothetical protein ACFFDB_00420 [Promethearchaeota archaeon]